MYGGLRLFVYYRQVLQVSYLPFLVTRDFIVSKIVISIRPSILYKWERSMGVCFRSTSYGTKEYVKILHVFSFDKTRMFCQTDTDRKLWDPKEIILLFVLFYVRNVSVDFMFPMVGKFNLWIFDISVRITQTPILCL